jgi:hypothetical protein
MEHGMDDPFIKLLQWHPPTTTKSLNRHTDYILTFRVPIKDRSTLVHDTSAKSDNLGICLDIDIQCLFASTYSELGVLPRGKVTLDNVCTKTKYENYMILEFEIEQLWERTHELYLIAIEGSFDYHHEEILNEIDDIITRIMLLGEDNCAHRVIMRDPWSPKLRCAGHTLSYLQ